MKKHVFTLLVVCIFTGISAQNYTQVFDSVLQPVDLSNTSSGLLYEWVPQSVNLTQHPFSTITYQTNSENSSNDSTPKNSIGISALCSFVGISLKYNLKRNLYLQTDIGGNAYINFLFIPHSPTLGADFGAQIYLLYEDLFPKRTNTYWIVGGGLNFAGVPHIPYSKQVSLKGGAKVILGIEFIPEKTPISIQIDTRLGYGIMYSTKGVRPWERNSYLPGDNPYHFFDYGFVFSLRFHFSKRIR